MNKVFLMIKKIKFLDVASVVVIAGVIFSVLQLKHSAEIESARLILDFNNQLRTNGNNYSKILYAIDNNLPLLQPNGEFSSLDIYSFLLEWELLDQLFRRKLIQEDMAYQAFYNDVAKTWGNVEIQEFIKEARNGDKGYVS